MVSAAEPKMNIDEKSPFHSEPTSGDFERYGLISTVDFTSLLCPRNWA